MIATQQRDLLRRLAGEVAQIAARPEQEAKREAWKRLNSLRPERPMVWITEIPWSEFEHKTDELRPQCEDPELRHVEQQLRRKLFTARRLPCDEVVEAVWTAPPAVSGDDMGVEIKESQLPQGDTHIRSHHYEPVIKDFPDIDKIQMPHLRHDQAETQARTAFFESLFGGALRVDAAGPRRQWFNGWDTLVRWTGVTEALWGLVDRPDFIHALMRRLTDATLARLGQYEALGLLGYPHPVPRVGSGGAGYTDELPRSDSAPDSIRAMDQWGGATAQILGEVSPAMHEEFALKYEIEVMERTALNYYGCCEPLHNKMGLMAKAPRLRKVSISAWCDVEKAAATAGRKYVFSHKPSPACFAGDRFDAARAEQDLRSRVSQSGDMPCEIIMKDISTVRGDPQRLMDWCRMAHRVAQE